VSSRSNGSSGEERQGIQPRYRRAFGCVTWLYTAILAFLAAAFLLLLPFRYVGSGDVYKLLGGLSFFGLVLILPGTALAAALGARTYRTLRRTATRVGAGIGALIGWTSFAYLSWLRGAIPPVSGGPKVDLVSYWLAQGAVFFIFPPLAAVAAGLVLYALFSSKANFERRRNLVLVGTVLAVVAGLAVLLVAFEPLALVGALASVAAAALAGWVAGVGYARAGGDEMIPPGTVRRPPPK
jgi:hypothetical protein